MTESATQALRLLAIEDNPGDVRLLRETLAEAGGGHVRLESAGTLAAGIAALARDSFDAVLLDLSLPDSQGRDTITRLRAAAPHIPVVVMTSLSDEAMVMAAATTGVQDYLVKGQDSCRVVLRAVRYATERQRWQEHSANARKLEAVGRLTGALAHEYNNLLTPVIGYCDLLRAAVEDDPNLSEMVARIRQAGERAALVTAQLLALGGHKRVRLGPLNLNEAIRAAEGMLRETVGSRVQLIMRLNARLDLIRFDASELEHLLTVLAINALEAMAGGGDFIIETTNQTISAQSAIEMELTPRPHVVLIARDSGAGMSKETSSQILEPFAKPSHGDSKTTGLGLAALNGTLRATGARMFVESRPGEGSTFTIYFPQLTDAGMDPAGCGG